MNEIVKYANDFNKLNLSSLTANQQNILFTILTLLKEADGETLEISLNKILDLAKIDKRSNTEYVKELLNSLKDLQAFVFRYKNGENIYVQENIFPKLILNTKKQNLKIQVSKEFKRMYLAVYANFTRFQLAEFAEIPSIYAKTIYRCLKQYRTKGFWSVEWSEFLEILGIPESYRASDIDKQILKPALKYLTENTLFDQERIPFKQLQFKKNKTGKKIERIEFTFMPENTDKTVNNGVKSYVQSLKKAHQQEIDYLKEEVKNLENFYRNKWLKFSAPKDKESQRYGIIQKISYIDKIENNENIILEIAIYYKKPELINSNFVEIIEYSFSSISETLSYLKQIILL